MTGSNRMAALAVLTVLSGTSVAAQSVQKLSLHDAEQIAVQNHPQIQAATDIASAAKAQVTEQRSAYYPTAYGSVTAADSENNSRIAAGALNNPIIYERYANGLTVNQLVTDFGRTHELVKSSDLHARAEQENVATSRADVLLGVDQAYFAVQKAQSVLNVAQETVKERQLVADQVGELEKNKIKSGLDLSFANVDLAQAQLLLVQAQNDLEASYAQLSAALGYEDERTFELAEEPVPPAPSANFADLLEQALQNRPELISLRLDADSAHSYARAERDLSLPTISATGSAGLTPVGADQLAPRYAAAGVNVNIPIFNGHLFGALRSEANSRAKADDQYVRDLQNRIVRDVRTAWLNSNSAFQRLALTEQLLRNSTDALDLAQARYKLGLSSIIELSQAQLNLTQAELESASSKFDYQTLRSVLKYQLGQLQ
ncbi:MAG TPA: TolC family protein [Candidatus Acidoferrales bacterium]|jgi:outer membrane protein|nr:TolC family protein [Candidatus Acidoferrales bacterium]